jgi:uncharacterized membrane protein
LLEHNPLQLAVAVPTLTLIIHGVAQALIQFLQTLSALAVLMVLPSTPMLTRCKVVLAVGITVAELALLL